MECDKTKKTVSLVLLVAAVLIYFLTEWPIWIPILVLVFAIIGLLCKCKCKECSPTEEKPVEEEKVEEVEKTPTEAPVEAEPVEEEKVEEVPVETVPEVEEEPKEEVII